MKSTHSHSYFASALALVFSIMAAPSAMAAQTMYPGSNCGYEARGTVNTIGKGEASVRSYERKGQIVTCPIPINVPLAFQSGQQTSWANYTVTVHVRDYTKGSMAKCSIQKVSRYGSVNNSDVEYSSGDGNGARSTLIFDRVWFALPLHEWAVLRCHIMPGTYVSSYAVSTRTY